MQQQLKLCKVVIKGFQQFRDIELDFTDKNGEPLDKICFIGRNGTGKTTLLNILSDILRRDSSIENGISRRIPCLLVKYKVGTQFIYHVISAKDIDKGFTTSGAYWYFDKDTPFNEGWEKEFINWTQDKRGDYDYSKHYIDFHSLSDSNIYQLERILTAFNRKNELVIFSPAEDIENQYLRTSDVPPTTLNAAIELFKFKKYYHLVSNSTSVDFWNQLVYLIKKREDEKEAFEISPENINKTKRDLITEFDKMKPQILDRLGWLWNKILANAGIEFDVEGAKKPVHLTDNLKAYVRLISNKQTLQYSQLSMGIRNFIFRIGHIYSLYFDSEIERGFLFIDEPENSLFPDFLLDLVRIYKEVTIDQRGVNKTQTFMATHNPIVAAQFKPEERIILDFDKNGNVTAQKGTAPIGDDPNDILRQDFEMKNLMSEEGTKVWEHYIALKKQLRHLKTEEKKEELISEINRIGQLYSFN